MKPNEKNRKCSAAKSSKLPIKDKKKDKLQHLKASKSDLTTKNTYNRTAANQSHFYLVINSEDADQSGRLRIIIDQTMEADASTVDGGVKEKNLVKSLARSLEKSLEKGLEKSLKHLKDEHLNDQCISQSVNGATHCDRITENLNKASPEAHIYQNELHILTGPDERRTVSDQSALPVNQSTNQETNQPANQPVKKECTKSSFTPKPLMIKKMIKKRLRKKSKELDDQLNDRSNGAQPAAGQTECSPNSPPPNSQQQLNSQINQQSTVSPAQHLNPNGSPTASQRRRRQNQSFENLSERLEYISQTAAHTAGATSRAPREHDELKSGYKSEDNLLHIVPSVPRSLAKLSANEKQFLKKVEESLTNHHSKLADDRLRSHPGDLNSTSLQYFSENPSYAPFVQPERVSESVAQQPAYVNDPCSLQELCSRPRMADLISLREHKPRRFLVPELTVTSTENESKKLVYVNLQFNDDQPNESNDSSTPADSDSSNVSAAAGQRKCAGSNERIAADLNRTDLSKSTDLKLLRSTKPSSYKQSKSDDESRSKVEYCKIDFMATESLSNLKAIRLQNHHHLA